MIKQKTFEFVMYFLIIIAFFAIGLVTGIKSVSCVCTEEQLANQIIIEDLFYCDMISLDRATTYQPTKEQCDDNPYKTADGSIINPDKYQKWVALSRDLICDPERRELFPNDSLHWRGDFHFGDTIEIYSEKNPNLNGPWVVHDVMSSKYKMSIDFLLAPEDNVPKLGVGTDVKIVYCGINY